MEALFYIVVIAIVFLVEMYAFVILTTTRRCVGALRIDDSDPDGPYIFLELRTDVNQLRKCETVRLRIINENYISR